MTNVDWILLGTLAISFHVEEHGKELWLVKHDGPIVDGLCSNGKNIPFRPHILCAKADSIKTAVEVFGPAAEHWQPLLAHFRLADEQADVLTAKIQGLEAESKKLGAENKALDGEVHRRIGIEIEKNIEAYRRPHEDYVWSYARILLDGGHPPSIVAGAQSLVRVLSLAAKDALRLELEGTSLIERFVVVCKSGVNTDGIAYYQWQKAEGSKKAGDQHPECRDCSPHQVVRMVGVFRGGKRSPAKD